MPSLEAMQTAWEITTKAFEKMSDKEKAKWFNKIINDLEENDNIKQLKDKRDSMTEDQKLKLYKRNAVTTSWFLKRGSPIYQVYSSIAHGTQNRIKIWWKNALTYALLEQIPCRFFVELGILKRPEWLSEDQLIKDVKKDAKNFNTYLNICERICNCIPETKAAVPFIWMAKQYSKRYKDHWTEIVISKLNEKKELDIKKQTCQELEKTMKDTEKSLKDAA